MTGTELHLLLNHLPVVGTFFGLALALLSAWRPREAGVLYAAALVLGLSASGGVGAYLSGEEAEEALEERGGVEHDAIEAHEDAAPFALGFLLAAAASGGWLAYGVARGRTPARVPAAAFVVLTALSAATMARMGLTGRALGHPAVYGEPR